MSVPKLSEDLIKKDDVVYASKINTLFRKLEEIRLHHIYKHGFTSSTPSSFNTTMVSTGEEITPEYAQTLKEYITLLEKSRFIRQKYHDQITIPRTNDYIQAQEILLSHVKTINELAAIDANCGSDHLYFCLDCRTNKPAGNSNTPYNPYPGHSSGDSSDDSSDDRSDDRSDDYTNGWNQGDSSHAARSS